MSLMSFGNKNVRIQKVDGAICHTAVCRCDTCVSPLHHGQPPRWPFGRFVGGIDCVTMITHATAEMAGYKNHLSMSNIGIYHKTLHLQFPVLKSDSSS